MENLNDIETVDVSATPATEVSENTITETNAADTKEKILYLDFNKLVADYTRNPRLVSKYSADGPAGDKARSIHKHGLLNPLLVNRRADGTLVILQGHLRHGGIKLIRTVGMPAKGKDWPAIEPDPKFMDKVKCRVVEGLTPTQELDLIMDHGTTTALDKREQYQAARNMFRARFSEQLIAEKLGLKSRGPASILVRVARMPQVVEDMYLADPKSEGYVPLTDTAINELFKAYTADQKLPGARIKEGGKEFNAALEKIVKQGPPTRNKGMSAADMISLAETETDPDIRDLLEGLARNESDDVNAAIERLHIRLKPFYGDTTVIEEGISRVVN